jgi:hypothetical protein
MKQGKCIRTTDGVKRDALVQDEVGFFRYLISLCRYENTIRGHFSVLQVSIFPLPPERQDGCREGGDVPAIGLDTFFEGLKTLHFQITNELRSEQQQRNKPFHTGLGRVWHSFFPLTSRNSCAFSPPSLYSLSLSSPLTPLSYSNMFSSSLIQSRS